jgi:endonuclease/exonuclease/phosphatase (EEP) superfamily protein YafD
MRWVASKWTRRLVRASAIAYPVALLAIWISLRWIGEAWWASTAALYLPCALFGLPLPFVVLATWLKRMRSLAWAQAVGLFLLVFPIMSFVLPWPSFADASAPKIRIVSLNVNAGRAGLEKVVEAISGYSPDVVLLQETDGNDAFVPVLRARYPTVSTSTQFALATRFPLVRVVEPEKLPYYGQLRSPRFIEYVLDTTLGTISFFNAHPISPREGLVTLRGEGLRHEIGSGRLLEGTRAHVLQVNTGLRTIQVEALARAASLEPAPVVVAGDTNLPAPSPLLHRTLGEYDDAFRQAGWGFGNTFPTNSKKGPPWMRIDRILARGPVRFVHFEIGRPVVSDHHFVVADLQSTAGAGAH